LVIHIGKTMDGMWVILIIILTITHKGKHLKNSRICSDLSMKILKPMIFPLSGIGQAVPRHNEIKETTAKLIIKTFS
jgi:hypothetical protein